MLGRCSGEWCREEILHGRIGNSSSPMNVEFGRGECGFKSHLTLFEADMSDNEEHRRDIRSKDKFREDIVNGIRLQGFLGQKLLDQFQNCRRMIARGFRGMEWETDDAIYDRFEDITGDARMFFGRMTIELEFKTKDKDSDFFTLKQLDLERCVKKGKPIFMANRMISESGMVIRFMSLDEIKRMLKYPAVPIKWFGDKPGYRINEDLFSGWISAKNVDSDDVYQAYSGCLGMESPEVYPWEVKPREKKEYEEKMALACKAAGCIAVV